MAFLLKPYEISVFGCGSALYEATTPGRARATAFLAFTECRQVRFRDFLSMSTIRRVRDPERFGEPVLVSGRPAYLCL